MKRFFWVGLTLVVLVILSCSCAVAQGDVVIFKYTDSEGRIFEAIDFAGPGAVEPNVVLCAESDSFPSIGIASGVLAVKEMNGYVLVASEGWTTVYKWSETGRPIGYVVTDTKPIDYFNQIVDVFGVEGGICVVANTSKGLTLCYSYNTTSLRSSDQAEVTHPHWQEVNLGKCNDYALLSDNCFYAFASGSTFSVLDPTAEPMKAVTYKLSKGIEVHREETYVGFVLKNQLVYLTANSGANPLTIKLQKGEEADFAKESIGLRFGEYYRAMLIPGEGFKAVDQVAYEKIFAQP